MFKKASVSLRCTRAWLLSAMVSLGWAAPVQNPFHGVNVLLLGGYTFDLRWRYGHRGRFEVCAGTNSTRGLEDDLQPAHDKEYIGPPEVNSESVSGPLFTSAGEGVLY